jgi:hypothetical protein
MSYRMTATEKADRAERRRNVVNPFAVGDIVVETWGYDQTNADFYRVLATTAKSCRLRRLASEEIESRPLAMSGHARPLDAFDEGSIEFLARIKPTLWDGQEPYVNTPHGGAGRWDGNPVPVSWYG